MGVEYPWGDCRAVPYDNIRAISEYHSRKHKNIFKDTRQASSNRLHTMTIENSKLHSAPPDEEDIPFAEVLPLNNPNSGTGPKLVDRSARAYAVGYKNYQADEETLF